MVGRAFHVAVQVYQPWHICQDGKTIDLLRETDSVVKGLANPNRISACGQDFNHRGKLLSNCSFTQTKKSQARECTGE